MIYLVAVSLAVTIFLAIMLVSNLLPNQSVAVRHRIADVEALGLDPHDVIARRRRQERRQRVVDFLQAVGDRLQTVEGNTKARDFLLHAGYTNPSAVPIYWGVRLVLALGLASATMVLGPVFRFPAAGTVLAAIYFAAVGYVGPVLVVRVKRNRRQKEIQLALADALDLLVVCVEAGLGLNQALLRVADEIRHVSVMLSRELTMVNAEIRAGAAREDALRHLADRTGLEDIRSLTTMLIQTDRFGTSIARSLRVHSDTLRMKRRQRAEEAAAKTAIKLVFPLVFCIFPALFVVLIGPGLIQIIRALGAV